MASLEEINAYLMRMGLKPMRSRPGQGGAADDPENNVLGQDPTTEEVRMLPSQPKWKWSWDPEGGLLIWRVDPKYGQPHHIEMTGPNFHQLAQGRVYVDTDGYTEITVWEDRATPEWQEAAVEDVDAWLKTNVGREADYVDYLSEGGYYQTIDETGPDKQKMIETYFGVGFDKIDPQKRQNMIKNYDAILQDYQNQGPPQEYSTPKEYQLLPENTEWCDMCEGLGGFTGKELIEEQPEDYGHLDPNAWYTCAQCKGAGKVGADEAVEFA